MSMHIVRTEEAIRKIENDAVRAYAWAWFNYRVGDWPQPKETNFNLNSAKRQTIRRNIFDILYGFKTKFDVK